MFEYHLSVVFQIDLQSAYLSYHVISDEGYTHDSR